MCMLGSDAAAPSFWAVPPAQRTYGLLDTYIKVTSYFISLQKIQTLLLDNGVKTQENNLNIKIRNKGAFKSEQETETPTCLGNY